MNIADLICESGATSYWDPEEPQFYQVGARAILWGCVESDVWTNGGLAQLEGPVLLLTTFGAEGYGLSAVGYSAVDAEGYSDSAAFILDDFNCLSGYLW